MQQQIKFGGRLVVFNLEFSNRKSLSIKVYPDSRVEVVAPLEAKEKNILDKVKLKAFWILKQIDHFNSFKPLTPVRRYVNGETHLYLGRQYRLKIVTGEKDMVKAYRGQLYIYSQNINPVELKKQLDFWYKQRALLIFAELLEEILPRFKRYKVSTPELSIRLMSKRWGSCTPAGRIILNIELIKAPKSCIEYVIIHELCHLIHHNHTKAFQSLLSRMLPDWKKWKDRLEYGLA